MYQRRVKVSYKDIPKSGKIQDLPSYPEDMTPEHEREFLGEVAGEYFPSNDFKLDTPEVTDLMKKIEEMQSRPDSEVQVLPASIHCSGVCIVDALALGLQAIGLKDAASKMVGKGIFKRLSEDVKDAMKGLLKEMTEDNMDNVILDISRLVYDNLSFNSLKASFGDLGWWDGITFFLSFMSIFLTAGAAFLLNLILFIATALKLIYDVGKCIGGSGGGNPGGGNPGGGNPGGGNPIIVNPYKMKVANDGKPIDQDMLKRFFNQHKDILIEIYDGHWTGNIYLPDSGIPDRSSLVVKRRSSWSTTVHDNNKNKFGIDKGETKIFIFTAISSGLENAYKHSLPSGQQSRGLHPKTLIPLFQSKHNVTIQTRDGHWTSKVYLPVSNIPEGAGFKLSVGSTFNVNVFYVDGDGQLKEQNLKKNAELILRFSNGGWCNRNFWV